MIIEYIILILLIIIYISYYFFFNIYETVVNVSAVKVKSDNKSKTKITNYPLNSFGKRVPFRSVYSEFNIIKGEILIYSEYKNKKKGFLELITKNKPGKVKIEIFSKYSLFPSIVEITFI